MLSISRRIVSILALISSVVGAMAYSTASLAQAAPYVEGRHYTRLSPAVPSSTDPGTVEVVEVFSYGCPACWQALPTVNKLKKLLPARAQVVYVPASFIPSEAWPMFQRAFITAQSLGIAEKGHDQMFDAVWRTGEIPLIDKATGRVRPKLPTIDDAAAFYARVAGVKPADFVAASKSFAVETRVAQAEKLVRAYRADSTPTFVVAGKFKVEPRNAGGYEEVIGIIRFLVDRELASAPPAPAAASRS
jgi:thiol:disulfide interchange protein DsbA